METAGNTTESTETAAAAAVAEATREVEMLASLLRVQHRMNRLLEENRKQLLTIKRVAIFFFALTLVSMCFALIPAMISISTILRLLSNFQR